MAFKILRSICRMHVEGPGTARPERRSVSINMTSLALHSASASCKPMILQSRVAEGRPHTKADILPAVEYPIGGNHWADFPDRRLI